MRAHRRPFGSRDAVDRCVAQRAVGGNGVRAQDAVLLRAQAFDGAAALRVQAVRAELDGDAVEGFEGVAEQQYQVLPISTRLLTASMFM